MGWGALRDVSLKQVRELATQWFFVLHEDQLYIASFKVERECM
ncbi:hypothetical protein MCY_00227 [Bartonella rattimassiliensis 15908]|uniref:Uncharacterized protein n=1 Tax=Bartonella rattimassiliensis 15908 TaxID=1094556 RepID=J0ZG85_9HYPH|nr:hypothetical protein MCY_00227 [Bartonella rattimassiliensis 15908]